MRVLYFIDNLFPGGAVRSLAAMAHCFSSAGLQLDVGYLKERTPNLRTELEGASANVFAVNGSSRLSWLAHATRLVRRRRPDLVHTTLFEADLVGRMAGFVARVPVVSSLVNLAYGPAQLGDPRLAPWKVETARWFDAATAQAVVRFHALSRDVAEVMGRRLYVPLQRIDVVPRGRDPARLGLRTQMRRLEARKKIGARADEIVLLAVARQEYQKGLDVLLEAFPLVLAQLPNARLHLCGRPGGATQDLEKRAAALGPTVRILGRRDDVPDLMCAADIVVLPSRWEGLGGALLEAMALETPIVASDLPAVREVLGNSECGWLVPPESPGGLRDALVRAIRDGEESRKKVSVARGRFLNEYTVDRVSSQMLELYDRALAEGPRARLTTANIRGTRSRTQTLEESEG